MIDEADEANEATAAYLARAAQARKQVPTIKPSGRCLACDERISRKRRWCDAECRDAWEAEQK